MKKVCVIYYYYLCVFWRNIPHTTASAKNLYKYKKAPTTHEFTTAWKSILGKNVVGVLPSVERSGKKTLYQALAMAKNIFRNVAVAHKKNHITYGDLSRFFEVFYGC
jgi:hypothetical protein